MRTTAIPPMKPGCVSEPALPSSLLCAQGSDRRQKYSSTQDPFCLLLHGSGNLEKLVRGVKEYT